MAKRRASGLTGSLSWIEAVRRGRLAVLLLALTLALAACGGDGGDDPDDAAAPEVEEPEQEPTEDAGEETGEDDEPEGDEEVEAASLDDQIVELCPPGEAPGQMLIGQWPGPNAAVMDEVLPKFQELTGASVAQTNDGTGDRLTKLYAEAGNPSMDASFVPIDEVPRLLERGVIMDTLDDIPGYSSLHEMAKMPGGYGANMHQLRLIYHPDYIDDPPDSWLDMYSEEYEGHYGFPGVPGAPGSALFAMISIELGSEGEDWETAIEFFEEHRDGAVVFSTLGADYEPFWETGDLRIHAQLSGVIEAAKDRGVPMEHVLPSSGAPVSMNVLVIPEGVQHLGCSKALIAYMLGEEVQVAFARGVYFAPTNLEVELPADVADRVFPQPDDPIVDLDWNAFAEDQQQMIDEWTRRVLR